MKLCILGGGGVRTPLIINGILRAGPRVPISQVTLYDIDPGKCRTVARLARFLVKSYGAALQIETAPEAAAAMADSSFILSSIRVGGLEARIQDESLPLRYGLIGQETTGAGGCAMALRTIPHMLQYGRIAERRAPKAWIINFTNPAGLITQAIAQELGLRAVGICDAPTELIDGILPEEGEFDYLGLNHLGWVRGVRVDGRDILPELLTDRRRIARIYKHPLFNPELIRVIGLVPNEYLYYYYCTERACASISRAGQTRARWIRRRTARLWRDLQDPAARRSAGRSLGLYQRYLLDRDASYMVIETGGKTSSKRRQEPQDLMQLEPSGYDRVALSVISALAGRTSLQIPLNVPNAGSMDGLGPADVVEVPCRVSSEKVRPARVGTAPAAVMGLISTVKEYERLTVRAAVQGSLQLAVKALVVHPLVRDYDKANRLLPEFQRRQPRFLAYLK